jgi:hypothetical protein
VIGPSISVDSGSGRRLTRGVTITSAQSSESSVQGSHDFAYCDTALPI